MRIFRILLILNLSIGAVLAWLWLFSAKRIPETPLASTPVRTEKTPALALSARYLLQGDTLVFRISGTNATSAAATFDAKPIPLFRFHDSFIGIVGLDAKAKTGAFTLLVKLSSGQELSGALVVKPRSFPVVALELPPQLAEKGITPEKLARNITERDKPALDAVFKIITPKIYFQEPFQEPLKNWVDVGGFGAVRALQDGSIRHLGVDLKGKLGDAVAATNGGVVRFSGELENFGKTVVIDHGLGIFSAYLHLSEIGVGVGQALKKGEIIGQVGSSGEYSLAPHLHFSIKIRGSSVDPRRFLDTANQFLQP